MPLYGPPAIPLGGGTMTGKLTTLASASVAGAGFNYPQGIGPASPVNGDIWVTTTGMYSQINGSLYTWNPNAYVNGTGIASATGAFGGGTQYTFSFDTAWGDARYGALGTANTWTGVNDFSSGAIKGLYSAPITNQGKFGVITDDTFFWRGAGTTYFAAPTASPALTGTPTAPTAAVDTSTTQIATTAFAVAQCRWVLVSAPTVIGGTVATVTVTFTADAYSQILVVFDGLSPDTSGVTVSVTLRQSSNGIVTLTTSADSGTNYMFGSALFTVACVGTITKAHFGVLNAVHSGGTLIATNVTAGGTLGSSASPDRIRLAPSSGNFNAGTIRVYGLKLS